MIAGMEITVAKLSSLVVAALCPVAAYLLLGGTAALSSGVSVVAPLALIWFPDEVGSYIGGAGKGPAIDQESPNWAVAGIGWLLLAACMATPILVAIR
jgi:hypothetical protein